MEKPPATGEFDSEAVKNRILHLKVMFDDAQDIGKQRDFLKSKAKEDEKNQSDLALVEEFNKVFERKKTELDAKLGTGVKEEPQGSTKMISNMMAEIRDLK